MKPTNTRKGDIYARVERSEAGFETGKLSMIVRKAALWTYQSSPASDSASLTVGCGQAAVPNRQSSAKQPVVVSQLGEPGTEVPFARREADAVHGSFFIWDINIIPDQNKKQDPI
jgi:hypothetical protein